MNGLVGLAIMVLPSFDNEVDVGTTMPSPMESTSPEDAGAIFSLNESLIVRGAVMVAPGAGFDSTSFASASAATENPQAIIAANKKLAAILI